MDRTRQAYYRLLFAFLLMGCVWGTARANLSNYSFGTGTGTGYDMSSATTLLSSGDDDGATADIGFTFYLDGTAYTKFSITTNGLVGLGNTQVSRCWENRLIGTSSSSCGSPYNYTIGSSIPQIAGLWDDMIAGTISYRLVGSAPNRVLVIEFNDMMIDYYNYEYGTWQVRLYERSNKIEFWYQHLDPSYGWNSYVDGYPGASIGIAASTSNYISVTPTSGTNATVSSSSANDQVLTSITPIPDNTLYTFNPCTLLVAGNTSQGGTSLMNNGDTLLAGRIVQRGSSQGYTPYSVSLDISPCTSRNYTFAVSGQYAGDYRISPASGTVAGGATSTPTLTFSPTGRGVRPAQLLVTDDNGFSRSFYLMGQGSTRIAWSGTVAQGGTPAASSGDTLLQSMLVVRGNSQSYTPITITNTNTNLSAPAAVVTYSITDPTGQFTVSPASTTVGATGSVSPVITFHATGVGFQEATLKVTADDESRTYLLRAFSAAPGGEFYLNGSKIGAGTALLVNYSSCVGEVANTQGVTVTNTGYGDFLVTNIDFYETDTSYAQGSSHPLLRDANGNPIPARDYVFTAQPGVAPISANPKLTLPFVVPQGRSVTFYFNYIGQVPGKRYARAFIRTNGQNFLGTDTNTYGGSVPPTMTEGLLNFDLFAQATGSELSDNPTGGLPKAIVFAPTAVGDSLDMTFPLVNAGTCDLRISQKSLAINTGDNTEFRLIGAPTGLQVDPGTGDYVLTAGSSTSLTVRFLPQQRGSRRASLMLKTNDSTIYIDGVAERGTYYMDLYGQGKFNVQSKAYVFGEAAILADTLHGVIDITNSNTLPLLVQSVAITGTDAGEFAQDAAGGAWPTSLTPIKAGGVLHLGVQFQPVGASPGIRQATLEVTLNDGTILKTPLEGTAGTRVLAVNPTTVNFPPSSVGKSVRQLITVTNTGTMPVTLTTVPTLSGTNATDFSLSAFPRLMLAPGQMEYLEVTYRPTVAGTSTATVTFSGNATGSAPTVTLMAQASKTKLELNPTDVVRVRIPGEAGGRSVSQSIVVRNEGAESIRVTSVELSGVDARQFRVVTTPGEIGGNGEGELVIEIQPNGHDLSASVAVHAENVVTGEAVVRQVEVDALQQRTSDVTLEAVAGNGMQLSQSVPNPAKAEATISYRLVKGGEMQLSLYDVNGVLVRQLEAGYRESGAHQVRVDLSGLASGQYVYRLNADGVTLSRTLSIVR